MNKRYRRNVAAVLSVGLLCACTAYWDETEENGVMYHLSRSGKEAFASEYTWDVHGDETEIIIPDEVNGAKVTQLGGYFGTGVPSPFCVLPSESGLSMRSGIPDPEDYGQDIVYRERPFHVSIGENVTEAVQPGAAGWYGSRDANGTIVFEKPVCTFTCDEDNPVWYAEDGIVYTRDGNQPVENLLGMTEPVPEMDFETLSFGRKLTGRYRTDMGESSLSAEVFAADDIICINAGSYLGDSLMSFFGGVLVPAAEDGDSRLHDPECSSMEMYLYLFSDFSYAGRFWPEMPVLCDVSVDADSLRITRSGSGEYMTGGVLVRDRTAPAQFPVHPEDLSFLYAEGERMREWYPVNPWVLKELETDRWTMKIFLDGTAVLVMKDTEVPEIYRGMCTIAYDADLRYLFTKLGGGTQPYAGRVTTGKTEDGETVFAVSEGWESDLLLPDGQETIVTVN